MTDNLQTPPKPALRDVAFFFDVDGTLVGIEQVPEAVKVSDRLRNLLQRLIDGTDGALALVSGRSIEQLDHLFGPLAFSASGLHGLEKRLLPGVTTRVEHVEQGIQAAREDLLRFAEGHKGVLVEDKGLTLALHYRMAPEHREAAAERVRKLVEADPDNLVVLEGKMVFEVKPPGFDKGQAIADFMQEPPFRGRRPIFAGDDVTDEAGFKAIDTLKGIAIKVGTDGQRTGATFGLPDVEAVLAWLDGLPGGAGEGA